MQPIEQQGKVLARISTGLVQLHSRHYGKGPTKAKTYLREDTVVCILKDGFTIAERTLIDNGELDAVHQIRRRFHDVMERPCKDVVEQAIGRRVVAHMSQLHHNPDLAVEYFMLEPERSDSQKPELERGSRGQQ
jgi:uncharacterized protein YbcI